MFAHKDKIKYKYSADFSIITDYSISLLFIKLKKEGYEHVFQSI